MSAAAERKPLPSSFHNGPASLSIQPSLKIGRPGDKYEREAESVANHVTMAPTQSEPALAMNPGSSDSFQMQPEEEEESLQMMPISASGSFLQLSAMEEEEETVQLFPKNSNILQRSKEEEESIQLSPDGSMTASPSISAQISSSKGGGQNLPAPVQSEMGSKIGADFSGVRIHSDANAAQMSSAMGAQAFTHGSDVYFNQGKYQPETAEGKHLLAHELTHTVQQGGAEVKRTPVVQMEGEVEAAPTPSSPGQLSTGLVNNTNHTITYSSIPVTAFKTTGGREVLYQQHRLRRKKNYSGSRVGVNQRDIWRRELDSTEIRRILLEKHNQANAVETSRSGSHTIYAYKVRNSDNTFLTGTLENVVREAIIPKWDIRGRSPKHFQVDHIVEMQISGYPEDTSVNQIDNLELLEPNSNVNSGEVIRESVESKIRQSLRQQDSLAMIEASIPRISEASRDEDKIRQIKNKYDLIFNDFSAGGGPRRVGTDKYWIRSQIEQGDHLEHIIPVNMSELGSEGQMLVFPRRYYQVGKVFSWNGRTNSPNRNERNWFRPWVITSKTFYNDPTSEVLGHFVLEFPSENPLIRATGGTVEIKKLPGAQFAGYVDNVEGEAAARNSIISAGNIAARQFSPIEINSIEYEEGGVRIVGKVLPSIPFIQNTELDLLFENGDIQISKTFLGTDFSFPSPFELRQSSLTLFASSRRGLGIEGLVNFGIQGVGEGHIGAAASTAGGFELEGAFNFDSELFDPAEIRVEYKNQIWTIGGTIGIPEGKIRGVKSATITATYSENLFSAEGVAELDIPGIEEGRMSIEYGENGFSIGGSFNLSSEVPGISGGSVEARVSKQNGEEEYHVFVSGTAQPDIPGINSTLTVTYEDGALTIEGDAAYSRGMLSGRINVTATNRSIGEEGQPTGDPTDEILIFGGGSLTLQITPWLAATAEVQFLPNGELEVTARLSSDEYEVFGRREINRNLFRVPTIEIPIFAIPLGPRSIGLVAQIGGGLDFTAGFGPGALQNMSAEITYNPAHEEETTLNGHGEFVIPADAGLTLRGDLSLGVSAGIASLTGGIELEGSLGLEGQALASVDVNWSPQTGLTIDASGRITVNPKFVFGINAFARASLGVGFLSVSETWRHNLASYEWGPDIQFGIVFPIHYQEGEPFALSFDDLEVIYPDLDVVNMAVGLARDIKDEIF
ncbi:DUF4157 domain-containing protein [Algoriphagus sp. AGSA1]|uniref:eCIS core domain-containing protein n=1 Tax=Algoriphagus sp. AGSA1 TaxID=2907213 RepID=UPI001F3ECF5F|nr:DUF4157 domain-containing protein [Algoriphagus sp. AGSA1]MCE7056379.1 DUF4157 domain-containing protein [Algoriphagus sp. AGSA1]